MRRLNPPHHRPGVLVDDGECHCCMRIGRLHLICGKKNSHFPYTCLVGPDWYCMCVTYGLIIGPTVLFIHNVAVFWGPGVIVVTVILAMITLGFFTMTACSDPGIVFAPKPVFDSIDDTDGVLLTNLTQSNENTIVAEERRNSFQSQCSHSSSSSSSNSHNEQEHLTEEHRMSETGTEDRMIVDIESGEGGEELVRRDKRNRSASSSPSSTGSSSDKRNSHNPPNRILITNKSSNTIPTTNPNRNTHNTVGGVLNNVLGSTTSPAAANASHYLPPPAPAMIECGRCHIDRPRDASHCYDCGVCVKKLDHHCPWTGKCIGQKTLKNFYSFLWSLMALISFVLAFVIASLVRQYSIFSFHNNE